MTRLLVDLTMLRHPFCGLGQVADAYGRWLGSHADALAARGLHATLLLPAADVGRFGPGVDYLAARDAYRLLPWVMPRFDVWHSIHQLSPFRPSRRDTRRLLTIHDVNFLYEKQGAKRERYRRRLQREVDSAAELCFISHFAEADTARAVDLGRRPRHVIYDGVAPLTDGPQAVPAGVDPDQPFLLSIGVLRPKKNIHTLLPMMRLLPHMRLLVAGDNRGDYARRLSADAPANVRFLGPVSDDERRWLFARCTALLFPSACEGFGLPVIEAMQWGKPVICSNLTCLPEVGGDLAYYLTDLADPAAMADTVAAALRSHSPRRAEAERAHAASFSYDNHFQQYLKLYAGS